jgi:hypothetical protein
MRLKAEGVPKVTSSQIEFILGSANMNEYVHIPQLRYLTLTKDRTVIKSDIKNVRFKFDTVNGILEVVYVRPFSQNGKLPHHGNYDTMDLDGVGTVFEYLSDVETNDVIRDFYGIEEICVVGLSGMEQEV